MSWGEGGNADCGIRVERDDLIGEPKPWKATGEEAGSEEAGADEVGCHLLSAAEGEELLGAVGWNQLGGDGADAGLKGV